jgi:hypothetical protein
MLLSILAAFALMVIAPVASFASTKGRKNTAIVLTGIAAYELIKGHTGAGLLAAGGAGYAWKRYNDTKDNDRHHRYYRSYSNRDDSRWNRGRDDNYWNRGRDDDHRFSDNGRHLGQYKHGKHDNGRRVGSRHYDFKHR